MSQALLGTPIRPHKNMYSTRQTLKERLTSPIDNETRETTYERACNRLNKRQNTATLDSSLCSTQPVDRPDNTRHPQHPSRPSGASRASELRLDLRVHLTEEIRVRRRPYDNNSDETHKDKHTQAMTLPALASSSSRLLNLGMSLACGTSAHTTLTSTQPTHADKSIESTNICT